MPHGTPLAAPDAARVVGGMLDQIGVGAEPWGVFHYTSSDRAEPGDLEEVMLAATGQFLDLDSGDLRRETLSDRPPNTTLDCRKIRDTFAIKQVPWRDAMTATVKQFFQSNVTEEPR
mgnify:FL=1